MLEELINEYIEAYYKARLHDMLRIEKAINGLGMSSADLREKVKEVETQRKVAS